MKNEVLHQTVAADANSAEAGRTRLTKENLKILQGQVHPSRGLRGISDTFRRQVETERRIENWLEGIAADTTGGNSNQTPARSKILPSLADSYFRKFKFMYCQQQLEHNSLMSETCSRLWFKHCLQRSLLVHNFDLTQSHLPSMEFEKPARTRLCRGLSASTSYRHRKFLCQWSGLHLLLFGLLLAALLLISLLDFPVSAMLHPNIEVATNPVKHSLLSPVQRASCSTKELSLGVSHITTNEFSQSTVPMSRVPDTLDAFTNYRYRNHTNCQISSLDLHTPFVPLCSNRAEVLTAISGGGRIGKEAPFMPRGCDMRWFSTEEICEIFERFEKVIVVGDSMMRHVVGAMNVLLRKDLGYGAVTNWNFSPKERYVLTTHKSLNPRTLTVFAAKNASATSNSMSKNARCKASTKLPMSKPTTPTPLPVAAARSTSLSK